MCLYPVFNAFNTKYFVTPSVGYLYTPYPKVGISLYCLIFFFIFFHNNYVLNKRFIYFFI